ncbi:MAG: hypothetical protein FJ088_01620 [Deltaproteobacteria bacterium]|nr:hypothetical protein [Deltaproteobacteria bacterium]
MEALLKKYFWVVNLLMIGIAAYLLAGTVNNFIEGRLFGNGEEAKEKKQEAASEKSDFSLKKKSSVSLESIFSTKNLFNSDPPEPVEEEAATEEEPAGILESNLDIKLLGTLVSTHSEWSMATIQVQSAGKLVKIGVKIMDSAEVVDIQRRYILLQEGSKTKIVRLWSEKTGGGSQFASTSGNRPPGAILPQHPAIPSTANYSAGVKKLGEHDYQIDKSMLDENLQDLTKLGMDARIVPNYKDGKYEGFKLIGIRPDSLYRAIGIQSGDIIKSINGKDIDTPNKAIELFDQLKNSKNISLSIERRGQPATLTYQIK